MLRALVMVTTAAAVLAIVLLLARAGLPYAASAQAAQSAPIAFPAPDEVFRMTDGFVLPARVWHPPAGVAPRGVILALHGFTDSRDAWEYPAPGLAAAGYTVIAPDQRGFGATADRGVWAGQAVMIDDAAELARQLRARYPGQRLVLFGESMGGAVAMCLAARAPGAADAYVLVSPAVWGRAEMALPVRSALWAAYAVAPGWKLTGTEVPLEIAASDNREALLRLAHDPLTLRGATVRTLRGLVDLMDSAQAAARHLPPNTLLLNGRRDQVIPQAAIAAMWAKAPAGVRRAIYLNGYHLLLRDLDRALVQADVLAWLDDPQAWLPSGADVNAAAWQADQAWNGEVSAAAPARLLDGSTGRSTWPY
jgi:alpha-beta hydrolase superfamily lysophospholipase